MKEIIVLFIVFASYTGYSQIFVGDININTRKNINYVELVGITKNFKTEVYVDYGQAKLVAEEIRDKKGTISRPGNVVSVLNLMTKNGWEFVSNYSYGSNGESVVRYLLKKNK